MAQLSVIVPVYNVQEYLREALDSVLDQTLADIEVVCVDDGSTDSSGKILDEYAAADARVRVIHQDDLGVSAARNRGIAASSAPVLCFLDPDDALAPQAAERIVETFGAYDPDLLVYGAEAIDEQNASVWLRDHLASRDASFEGFDARILFTENTRPFIWRIACARRMFEERGLSFAEGLNLGEDQLFCMCAYPLAQRVRMISDVLYRYRPSRPGSLMSKVATGSPEQLRTHLQVVRRAFARWDELGILDENRDLMLGWLVEFVLYDALRLADGPCRALFDEAAELLAGYWDAEDLVLHTHLAAPVWAIVRMSVRHAPLPAWRRMELMVRYYRHREGLKALMVRFARGGAEFSA